MMTTDQVITTFSVLIAAGSLILLAVKGRYDAKKGVREVELTEREVQVTEKTQANEDAKLTIDLLRQHRDEREAEIKEERREWRDRERRLEERNEKRFADLEERVKTSESAYTALVLTVTTMSFCAKAATCPNVDSGDRRRQQPTIDPDDL